MELDEVAQAAAVHGEVTGVLAAESLSGERSYLVSLGDGDAREWLLLNTAVELTSAALAQVQVTGTADEQALALRDSMRVLFPEAVALVSAARQGFMRES